MKRTIQSLCGIFIIAAIMVVTMASLCQEEAHASDDMLPSDMLPRNVHWEGTTAVWEKAEYQDDDGTWELLEYEASLFNITNGADVLIARSPRVRMGTSANFDDVISALSFSGDEYKIALRVRTFDPRTVTPGISDYVSAEPITLHNIGFDSMGGSSVSEMVVVQGNTHSFPEDPTKNGSAFAGWYTSNSDFESESNRWDFERDKVKGSMTLYAKWIEDGQHVHSVGGNNVSFKPWARTKSLPTEGNYYLLYDVDLAYDANITGKVNLCLAGHTVTCGDRQIKVKDGGSLDLLGPEEGGKITGSTNLSGAIHVEGGEFTMHSGSITGNEAFSYGNDPGQGGAIRVSSGSAKMLGGSITNNVAGEIGGAVAVMGGSFELAGGTISGNKAGERGGPAAGGGAVGVSNGASFIMSGGLITGNETVGSQINGSAIHVRAGTFYVSGGTITGNSGNSAVFINATYGGNMQISQDGAKTSAINISANSGSNVRLFGEPRIEVNGEIDETSEIGITPVRAPNQGECIVFTNGLKEEGDVSIFKSDNDDYTVVDDGNGEAAFKNYWKLSYKAGDHSSGGEMEPSQIRVVDEENFTFPECGYLPENGYEFAGWKVDNNTYQKDDTLKITGHRDVTATWKAIDYSIAYDLDEGALPEGEINPTSYTIESSDITLVAPERKGYTFTGWTGTGIDGDAPVKDVVISAGSQGGRAYKANWEIIEYKISYKLNGGKLAEGKSNPDTYTVEDEIRLNEPERAKFVFQGWLGTDLEEETKDLIIEKGTTGNRTYIAIFEEMCKDGHAPGDAVRENERPAKCDVDGSYDEVVYCSKCGDELSRRSKSIKAEGHNYDTPTYKWSRDNSMATATVICKNDDSHVVTETVDVESRITKKATYEEKGVITYTAPFTKAVFKEQTKTASIPKLTPAPGSDPSQTGTDGTPVGPGASAAAADKAITSMVNDKDPQGAVFGKIKLKSTKQTKTAVTLRWTKQSGAKTYVVYGNRCGKTNKPQKLATVTGSTYNCQKLKKGIYYKFIVVALDQNNNVISTSKLIHVATKGGKVGNHRKVTVTKAVIKKAKALRKGRKLRIKAKAVVQSKRQKVKKHVGLRYESTNTSIATVSAKGVITAKKKGSCFVYIYAQNGVYKRIKVKVA